MGMSSIETYWRGREAGAVVPVALSRDILFSVLLTGVRNDFQAAACEAES
jgi:hypothetical protein